MAQEVSQFEAQKVLGVIVGDTKDDIKRKYRALVKAYHPDVFRGDTEVATEAVKRINVAYDIISKSDFVVVGGRRLTHSNIFEINVEG